VTAPLLEARNLRVVRTGDAGILKVLDGADLTLYRGEVVDVSGPSGSGKTTFVRALALMLPDVAGELLLEGRSSSEIGHRAWRTRVALLPQRPTLFRGTVRDDLLVPWHLKVREGADTPSEASMRTALDAVGLDDVALDRDTSKLSVGQAARIAMVRVGLTRPEVLLLDEPDASLDEASAAQVAVLTARFAETGGVVRVRHLMPDAVTTRRERLVAGKLHGVGDSD
jgi:putative ABC transport system ATP-binding protein